MQAKLRKVATPHALRAAGCKDSGHPPTRRNWHVAVGNYRYRHLCTQRGLEPIATYALVVAQYGALRYA